MDKPFEVGEWVWYWGGASRSGWYEITRVFDGQIWFVSPDGEPTWAAPKFFTRDPQIPPKPKRVVTKEARCVKTASSFSGGVDYTFRVEDTRGTNVRCLYDTEE